MLQTMGILCCMNDVRDCSCCFCASCFFVFRSFLRLKLKSGWSLEEFESKRLHIDRQKMYVCISKRVQDIQPCTYMSR